MPVQRWHVFRVGQKPAAIPALATTVHPHTRLTGLRSFELQVLTLGRFPPAGH